MSDLSNQICGLSRRYKGFTGILITITVFLVAAGMAQNDENRSSVDSRQDVAGHTDKDKVGPQLATSRYPRYMLGADDVLDITFEFTPEFNQTVTVQPDGYITLRGAGDLHVGG